jgi:hypothetical protein
VAPLAEFDLERHFKSDVITLIRKENAISQKASASTIFSSNRAKMGRISAYRDTFLSAPWRSMALCGQKQPEPARCPFSRTGLFKPSEFSMEKCYKMTMLAGLPVAS